jgi:poly-gamma-glutamate capsule biosynthesis protein CapA/YwtB (metallophosphatase superfamily)
VSLANNHSLDFGEFGFDDTKNYLDKEGIFSFGSPYNDRAISSQVEIRGKNLCFVGYHGLYVADTRKVVTEVKRLDPLCDFVTVFAHWGVEYENEESIVQNSEAHEFIDAGADLVIGAHPHVIQPVEVYKEKAIFYSLGNFIFDQDFSLATRRGIAVHISLSDKKVSFKLIPIEMSKAKLYFPENVKADGGFALPR